MTCLRSKPPPPPGFDRSPVTWGRSVAEYPLLHGLGFER